MQKRVTVLLSPSLHKTVKVLAAEKGLTMQQIFLDAIKLYLQQYSNKWSICTRVSILPETSSPGMKKLQVQLDDQSHSLLKDYANAWEMTMSEVCVEALRSYMHKHSRDCGYIKSLFHFKKIKQDPRINKPCYGHPCLVCKHMTACRCGLHEGHWEMDDGKEIYEDLCAAQKCSDAELSQNATLSK